MSGSLTSVPVVSLLAFCLLHTVWAVDKTNSPPDCWTRPADVVWLLALTRNMTVEEFQQVKGLVTHFTQNSVISDTRLKMGVFVANGSDIYIQHFLKTFSDTDQMLNTMKELNYWPPDRINITKGLELIHKEAFTLDNGDRDNIPNTLIVVTDGMYENQECIEEEVSKISNKNITVFAVGIHNADNSKLTKITSQTFLVDDLNALDNLTAIKDIFCEDCRKHPADVVWLLDVSSNLDESQFLQVKNFVKEFTTKLDISPSGLNMGVATVSSIAHTAFSLNEYTETSNVCSAIEGICYWPSQRTNTTEGLKLIHEIAFTEEKGDRVDFINALIVVTDGMSKESSNIETEVDKILEMNITVFVVNIGGADSELMKLDKKLNVFNVTDLDDSDSVTGLTNLFCKEIIAASYDTTSETSPMPSSDTARKTITTSSSDTPSEISTTSSSETARKTITTSSSDTPSEIGTTSSFETARKTITTSSSDTLSEISTASSSDTSNISSAARSDTTPDCGTRPADVMWLLDLSSTLTQDNFNKVKTLVKYFTQKSGISPTGMNMGVFAVDNNTYTKFFLNTHSSTKAVLDAIDDITYWPPQQTNTIKGLELICTMAFTKDKGDRDGIPNILIVVTDGMPEDQSGIEDEIAKIRAMSINVFAVGVGSADVNELTKIASQKQNVFRVTDFDALDSLTGLTDIFCEVQHCEYKGQQYSHGAKWQDGCAYDCECVDGAHGHYQCYNKCPTYIFLPPQCIVVQPPGLCCLQPVCNFGAIYHTTSGRNVDNLNGYPVCVYHGAKYHQSQSWTVGCDMECSCYDAGIGHYICHSKCAQYGTLPSNCRLVTKPDECCAIPECEFYTTVGKFIGAGQPSGNGQSVYTVFTF